MLKLALFGVIIKVLQTLGQYQSQYGYRPSNYPQTNPCIPLCQPLPPCQPLQPAPYASPYPHSIFPVPVPVYFDSRDWNHPRRNNIRTNTDDHDDADQYNQHSKPPKPNTHQSSDNSSHYPNENNYDPPEEHERSGRPRYFSSRAPSFSVPNPNSGRLFSNIGAAAGNLAASILL